MGQVYRARHLRLEHAVAITASSEPQRSDLLNVRTGRISFGVDL
jgi:hypothetical protein